MAKSLDTYRDESREEFGEAGIEAAFPIWLIDIGGRGRRPSVIESIGIAIVAVMGLVGMVFAFVANLFLSLIALVRGQNRKRQPHERREIANDVTHARIVFRPDHIHVHEVRERMRAGGRLAELDQHTRVGMKPDDGGLRRTIVQIDDTRWALRPEHEPALRALLAARGVLVEPLD